MSRSPGEPERHEAWDESWDAAFERFPREFWNSLSTMVHAGTVEEVTGLARDLTSVAVSHSFRVAERVAAEAVGPIAGLAADASEDEVAEVARQAIERAKTAAKVSGGGYEFYDRALQILHGLTEEEVRLRGLKALRRLKRPPIGMLARDEAIEAVAGAVSTVLDGSLPSLGSYRLFERKTAKGPVLFRGTDTPVSALLETRRAGGTLNDFLKGHPRVSGWHAEAVWGWSDERLETLIAEDRSGE